MTDTHSDNRKRGEQALSKLNRELNARERKEKTRPLGVVAVAAVAILALVGGIWFMATRDGDEEVEAQDETSQEQTTEQATAEPLSGQRKEALPATVTCDYKDAGEAAKKVSKPAGDDVSTKGTQTVPLKTNQGDIDMELDRAVSPCTVNAIEHLAKEGYYNDTVCHRMTSGGLNVLQCGDPSGQGSGGPGFQFANEYPSDEMGDDPAAQKEPVTYPKGSIAMANAGADTNGSQFFLNYDDSELPPDYTYFGKVGDTGQKTLDGIAEKGVEGGAPDGKPAEEVKIESVEV